MYLCVSCYYDACLKSSALCVRVKTLHNTIQLLIREGKRKSHHFWPPVKMFWLPVEKSIIGPHLKKNVRRP